MRLYDVHFVKFYKNRVRTRYKVVAPSLTEAKQMVVNDGYTFTHKNLLTSMLFTSTTTQLLIFMHVSLMH